MPAPAGEPSPPAGTFTCVVDDDPRFHLEALRWYAALTTVAGIDAHDLVVHTVGTTSSEVLDFLGSRGVAVRRVERFDARSPHCNKISGALRLAEDAVEGLAVLCDADIVVLEDPRRMELPAGAVAGKVVDAPVPPLAVVLKIFTASGLPAPATVDLPWGPGQQTVSGNNNGGLYLVPGPLLTRVAGAWAHWAMWLLDRVELLEEWSVYVDQVAMALALRAESVGSVPLEVRWNTPTHDPTRIPPDPPEPAAIHYHQQVDRLGLIRTTGAAAIDGRIGVANDAVRAVWAQARPSVTHRLWLSQRPTTRREEGEVHRIVATVMDAIEPATVLDLDAGKSGFGQQDTRGRYRSIDGSRDALVALVDSGDGADLVLCLEQLVRPMAREERRDLLRLLWHSTRRALIISGLEDAGGISGGETSPERPLSALLVEVAPEAEIYPVENCDSVVTLVALRPQPDTHPRDFGRTTLEPVIARHPDPLGLLVLRLHALGTTTFYPDHGPRLWEYPVVAALIIEGLPRGSHLVDVGAGVTPLAPFLSSRGYTVDTVDPSTTIRTWPPRPDWNERDFLDYESAGLAHRSWNCALHDVPRGPLLDGAYAVSVIEHVPAMLRRQLLSDMAARTRPGGLVVLTIDIVPGTDDLWNLNLEVEVEPLTQHGTLDDVVDECAAVGLALFRRDVVRNWGPDARVDIGLLALRRSETPARDSGLARRRVGSLLRRRRT